MDLKIVTPAMTQIQKYIETAESLITEARDFIARKKMSLNEGMHFSFGLVRQSPEQARLILATNVIEPIEAIVEKHIRFLKNIYSLGYDWVKQELIPRYQRIASVLRDMPLNTHILLQMRVLEPAIALFDHLPAFIESAKNETVSRMKQSFVQIRLLARDCLEFIGEQLKKSSFWDGKQRMRPAM